MSTLKANLLALNLVRTPKESRRIRTKRRREDPADKKMMTTLIMPRNKSRNLNSNLTTPRKMASVLARGDR